MMRATRWAKGEHEKVVAFQVLYKDTIGRDGPPGHRLLKGMLGAGAHSSGCVASCSCCTGSVEEPQFSCLQTLDLKGIRTDI